MDVKLNYFCQDKGWLFEDLKNHLSAHEGFSSEKPESAEGWVCIRSSEIRQTPRLDRTIVQVHDLLDHDMMVFNRVAGVSFMHPVQYWLWRRMGFVGRSITCPIGAREEVTIPNEISAKPTLGFFCGEAADLKKGADIFEKAVLLARREVDFECLLIGRGLQHFSYLGSYEERAAAVNDYHRIDALFCASISPAVPLSVYEAARAGKVVISTPRWMPGRSWPSMKFGDNTKQLAKIIVDSIKNRERNFEIRNKISRSPFLLNDWARKNIDFSKLCIKKNQEV